MGSSRPGCRDRLGLLGLTTPTADPLNPASWIKAGPVFTGLPSAGVHGVGHASFTTSPDGTEHWIVYHSKTQTTSGWDDRVIRMQKFTWNADGTPNFGTPVRLGTTLDGPAGETAATLARHMASDHPLDHFLMLNGRTSAQGVRPGELVKIVTLAPR
mgnify:CR=1 FL=1